MIAFVVGNHPNCTILIEVPIFNHQTKIERQVLNFFSYGYISLPHLNISREVGLGQDVKRDVCIVFVSVSLIVNFSITLIISIITIIHLVPQQINFNYGIELINVVHVIIQVVVINLVQVNDDVIVSVKRQSREDF